MRGVLAVIFIALLSLWPMSAFSTNVIESVTYPYTIPASVPATVPAAVPAPTQNDGTCIPLPPNGGASNYVTGQIVRSVLTGQKLMVIGMTCSAWCDYQVRTPFYTDALLHNFELCPG